MNVKDIQRAVKPQPFSNSQFKGGVGYDNPRENIDPHVKTKVVTSREIDCTAFKLRTGAGATKVLTSDASGNGTWTAAAAGSGHVIKDEAGADLTARRNLNFTGAGVTATDNAGTDSTDITIAGGGSSTFYWMHNDHTNTNLNFNSTQYKSLSGNYGWNNNEDNYLQIIVDAVTLSRMKWRLTANTINDTTVMYLRINKGDGNQTVSFAASTSGIATDTTHSDNVVEDDLVSYRATSGGSSGSIYRTQTSIKVVKA